MIEWSRANQAFILTCDNSHGTLTNLTNPNHQAIIDWMNKNGWKRAVPKDAINETHIRHFCPACTVDPEFYQEIFLEKEENPENKVNALAGQIEEPRGLPSYYVLRRKVCAGCRDREPGAWCNLCDGTGYREEHVPLREALEEEQVIELFRRVGALEQQADSLVNTFVKEKK